MLIARGIIGLLLVCCWLVTVPMIVRNWRISRKHRKPDAKLAEAGLFAWDYSDCPKEPKWCEGCWQSQPYGLTSSYDRLVFDSMMLLSVTAICGGIIWTTQ